MKNLLALLFLGLLTLSFSCQSGGTAQDAAKDATEMENGEATGTTSDDTAPSEAYTVTVLKSDIPSPRKEMKGTIGGAAITVNYGSPSIKGRNLWGELVPYDQIWRAGANESTTFSISKDITIGETTLPAGKYGFFLYPKEGEGAAWEVIFNSVAEQWGAYDYDKGKDVARVMAKPTMVTESSETMEFMIEGNNLVLRWGKLKLPIAISA